MKIRIFLWQVTRDRLPTREQLLIRKGPTLGLCPLCSKIETIDHLLFTCSLLTFLWLLIKDLVGWPEAPHSVLDLISLTRYGVRKDFELIWIGAAATLWSIWTIRNKLIFEGKVLRKPTDAIFRIIFFLQSWRPLCRDRMQLVLDWVMGEARRQAKKIIRTFR